MCSQTTARLINEDDFDLSDEDISQFTNWTNAGNHVTELRSKAQEMLLKRFHDDDFDDSYDVKMSPTVVERPRKTKCNFKDVMEDFIHDSLSTPIGSELTPSSPIEVHDFGLTKRVTRSQVACRRGRGRKRRSAQAADTVDLTTSDDENLVTTLLPRPKILECSSVFKADDLDDEILLSSLPVEEDEINYEISVKVRWRFKDIHKFKIRKFQKFTSVFEFFSKLENITEDQILLTLNTNTISPADSPDSLKLSIADIVEGSTLARKPAHLVTRALPQASICKDSIQVKVCTKDSKQPMLVSIQKTDKMIVLMSKVSEELEKPLEELKFLFDGEPLNSAETPDDLELEGDELIEVRIASS